MKTLPGNAIIEISNTEGQNQPRTRNQWYWYMDGDHGGAIPFNVNVLYRGQNERVRPMLPSIARGLSVNGGTGKVSDMPVADQALVVMRLAQTWWFAKELQHHPISSHAEDQRLKINQYALAQHYEIPTGYLDLSDCFDVAAFFATCRKSELGWEPCNEGTGVVYRLALDEIKDPFDWLEPIGPQPLPRPDEQKAWVAEVPMHHSFDGWPPVKAIQFSHERSVGEHFLEKFDGGKVLFPPDPLTRVAEEILTCKQLPADFVDGALQSLSEDAFGPRKENFPAIREQIASRAELVAYRKLLRPDDLKPFMEDFEWRRKRLSEVTAHTRPVALHIRPQEK